MIGIIISMFSVTAITPHFLNLNAFHGVSRRQHENFAEFPKEKCKELLRKSSVFALQDVLFVAIPVDIDSYFVF